MSHLTPRRIGFVATRFAGTDGVSLESEKWADVLASLGHECFYFAGECDRPVDRAHVKPEAHFRHAAVRSIHQTLFEEARRDSKVSGEVDVLKHEIKRALYAFVEQFRVEVLVVENALSLPMNVPLGLAITEFIGETQIPTIAHHHDLPWERPRYAVHSATDYLHAAFPPHNAEIAHVVINSHAAEEMARRTGIGAIQIPNVMDFEHPPPAPDSYCNDLRDTLGLRPGQRMLLQPTRIVPRKRIERTIELARQLPTPNAVVISHSSGDEGDSYKAYLAEYAKLLGVQVIFAADRFAQSRRLLPEGQKVYSLRDGYHNADLVTYPSQVEGFGNAFLETIYYRRPLIVSQYEILRADIRPKGFEFIEFGEFIDHSVLEQVREWLDHPEETARVVERNYEIGLRHYSFSSLREHLIALFRRISG